MKYRVILAPSFREDVDRQIEYLLAENVAIHTIEQWFAELYDRIRRLDESPKRYPVDTVQSRSTGRETRKLNAGDYLVFYQVDDHQKQVNVVAFIHGARRREA